MNTIHMPETAHPPEQLTLARAIAEVPPAGVSFIDRIAMRVGMWLLLRSIHSTFREDDMRRAHELGRVSDAARQEHVDAVARAWVRGGQPPFMR